MIYVPNATQDIQLYPQRNVYNASLIILNVLPAVALIVPNVPSGIFYIQQMVVSHVRIIT